MVLILFKWLNIPLTLYSTIVMVNFKLQCYVVKTDPYKAAKYRVESNIKVGIRG